MTEIICKEYNKIHANNMMIRHSITPVMNDAPLFSVPTKKMKF